MKVLLLKKSLYILVLGLFVHSNVQANMLADKNCFHDLALLYQVVQTEQDPIVDFYFLLSNRFINQDLKVKSSPYGKVLIGEESLSIQVGNDSKRELFLFHEFQNTQNSSSYAATLGPSVVNVRVLNALNRSAIEFEERSFELASSAGFNVPMVFSRFDKDGNTVKVFQYLHGPNFQQLEQLHSQGKIDTETWSRVRSSYMQVLSQFEIFKRSRDYREFSSVFGEMKLRPESMVYYEDKWFVLEF